ncbi:hypothetical protein PS639_00609 [Pseudomonas fluorescens]|nr:hypothetical protein PS639_00609 [Pseudomonas fluorescens]
MPGTECCGAPICFLQKNTAFEGDIARADEPVNFSKSLRPDDTAAALFLHGCETGELPRNQPVELMGHSMGAIVAVNILARHAELRIDNLVFMGTVARIKEVESAVVPWLQRNPNSQFCNLSLDPYREMGENTFYDFMPRGSLLNWIDLPSVKSTPSKTAPQVLGGTLPVWRKTCSLVMQNIRSFASAST